MAEFKAIGLVDIEEETKHEGAGRPQKRMVLNPRFDWFLSDELITKIIPHTPIDSIPGAVSDSESSEESTQKDIFWQIYDELQQEEALSNYSEIDKVTVSGKKLEERLISTGEFYNGDAARMIREMVRRDYAGHI
jgi:hypothetical protein